MHAPPIAGRWKKAALMPLPNKSKNEFHKELLL
jgi:hypothetical protein